MFTLLSAVISSYFFAAAPCLNRAVFRDVALNRTEADFGGIASTISTIGASQVLGLRTSNRILSPFSWFIPEPA